MAVLTALSKLRHELEFMLHRTRKHYYMTIQILLDSPLPEC